MPKRPTPPDERPGCGAFRVGDQGQRYEVQGLTREGVWESIGWTEDEDGGNLAEGVRMWPRYDDVRVIDRGEDECST